MSRILITGSSGFLGRRLGLDLRVEGHETVGLDRVVSDEVETLILHDLRRPIRMNVGPVDACVHLASGSGGFLTNANDESLLLDERAMLENLRKLLPGEPLMVFMSSISVFEADGVQEEGPLAGVSPRTPYARSKAACERIVAERWKNFSIVRPTNFFGPNQPRHGSAVGSSHVIPELTEKIRRDPIVEVLGDGTQVRNFIHVSDLSRLVRALVEGGEPPRYVHLRSGIFRTIGALVRDLMRVEGVEKPVRYLAEYMEAEPVRVTAFATPATDRIGFAPRVTSIYDGLRRDRNESQPAPASANAIQNPGSVGVADRAESTAQPLSS